MPPIRLRGKTPPWLYLVLAAIFAANAIIWTVATLHDGHVGLHAMLALCWIAGAAVWVIGYFRRRRPSAER